jgi:hypothetical protein
MKKCETEYQNSAEQHIAHYKGSRINCGVMKYDQNWYRKGRRFNCNFYRNVSHTNVDNGRMCHLKPANTTGKEEREYLK